MTSPHRVSLANIGLAYLENAILDVLALEKYKQHGAQPGDVANDLGLYPNIKDYMDSCRPSGNALVKSILISLRQEKRVVSERHGKRSWKLTEKERRLRR